MPDRMLAIPILMAVVMVACGGASNGAGPGETSVATSITSTTPPAGSSTTTSAAVSTTTTEPASATVDRFSAAGLFEDVQAAPVITNGEPGTWNGRYTDPGAAVVHDGALHVLQNGFANWPARVGVGHWTSDDRGTTWVEQEPEPVFDGTDLPYVGVAALASSVHVVEDGTWVMYFYSWDQGTWPVSTSSIGRATAPAPAGPWTADDQPVLQAGPAGSWDEMGVRAPSVVIDESGYRMWYTGTTREQAMIGLATSADGITWQKHDDPETTEAAFSESDPVLVPGSQAEGNVWDQRNVYQPRVVATLDGLVMLYTSANTVTDPITIRQKIGVATSLDGLVWARSRGPVIDAADAGGTAIWWTELAYDGERYYLFFELGTGNETEVHLATHDGALPPG